MNLREELFQDDVMARAAGLRTLPVSTSAARALVGLVSDTSWSLARFCDVAKYDQAMCSKLLSIANSAYYSRQSCVWSFERAVAILGPDVVKNVAACMISGRETLELEPAGQEALAEVRTHSLRVAYAAKALSLVTATEDPEKVFFAAILHDVGRVAFCVYGREYVKALAEARRTGRDLCSIEAERFGVDHQEVGSVMARKWRFPEEFCAVIKAHHGMPGAYPALVSLVRAADMFSRRPDADLGVQGMILRRERPRIATEVERVSSLMEQDGQPLGDTLQA